MRILHIITSLDAGGAQTVLVDLVTHWMDKRDLHMVVSLKALGALAQPLQRMQIPVQSLKMRPDRVQPLKLFQLHRLVRRFEPDLCQTWLYHANLLGSLAVRAAGRAPIVWGIHHALEGRHDLKPGTWNVVRVLAALSPRLPSLIICCSPSALRTHVEQGFAAARMTVVENGVDTSQFRPDPAARVQVRTELGLDQGARLIGMFARFHPHKDHATLIDAAALLHAALPEVHFILAGDGIESSNQWLEERIREARLQSVFHLLGRRSDMPRLQAAMDVVTLSSRMEAMPKAIAEGMSCGVPCVATAVGDTPALIGDTGVLVAPGNSRQFADAWHRLLTLPDGELRRLSAEARSRIVRQYNLSAMVDRYRRRYETLLPSA